MTDSEIIAFLYDQFSARSLVRLDTPEKRQAAHRTFNLIADEEGAAIARAWMIGMNPQLDDQAPLLVIAAGRYRDVEVAARAYANGSAAS